MEYNTKYNRVLVFLFIISCVFLGFIIFLTYIYKANIYTVVYGSYSPAVTGWIKSTSLPQNISDSTSITYNGYIYEIGGMGGNVNSAEIQLPYEIAGSGGVSGNQLSTVYYAPINSNGTIGSWNTTTALPVLYGSVTEYNGYIYEIGANNATSDTEYVYYAKINNNGTIASWNTTSSLPQFLGDTAIAYAGYLYEIGGKTTNISSCTSSSPSFKPTSCPIPTVYYSKINTNGTIGDWNTTSSLPQGIQGPDSVAYNGYIYAVGGEGLTTPLSTVYYAKVESNGTLGSWNTTTSLPQSVSGQSTIIYNGYIYEIGGGSKNSSLVYYAQINSNGTIGAWTATLPLPQNIIDSTSALYNGYVYTLGGYNNSKMLYLSTVYYSKL
jgi:hypothetical protein